MQEHSIVLAPIISIGHLSTVPLAATAVATMISSITGYGVISGLTGYLLTHKIDFACDLIIYAVLSTMFSTQALLRHDFLGFGVSARLAYYS